jgi:hypothetical protein
MTKEEIEYHKFPITEDWTQEDQDNYERSCRLSRAICELLYSDDKFTDEEIFQDMSDIVLARHDDPNFLPHEQAWSHALSSELLKVVQRAEREYEKFWNYCPRCHRRLCLCGKGPLTFWRRIKEKFEDVLWAISRKIDDFVLWGYPLF